MKPQRKWRTKYKRKMVSYKYLKGCSYNKISFGGGGGNRTPVRKVLDKGSYIIIVGDYK